MEMEHSEFKNKINELADVKIISLFDNFQDYIASSNIIPQHLKKVFILRSHSASQTKKVFSISGSEKWKVKLNEKESAAIAKEILLLWAKNPKLAPYLEEFIKNNPDLLASASATILAIGAVINMLIITTSIEIEKNEDKWYINYSSKNISSNAITLVERILSLLISNNSKKVKVVENNPERDVILFVGASPKDKEKLNIEKEIIIINELLNEHPFLEFRSIEKATIVKLQEISNQYKPKILHFSCHGTSSGLFLEKKNGNSYFFNLIQFEEFIRKRSRKIDCVILSSCDSKTLGEKISKYIPYVIIMNEKIADEDSIKYASGFYSSLIDTREPVPTFDFENAHRAGKERLNLAGQEGEFTVEILKGDFYNS